MRLVGNLFLQGALARAITASPGLDDPNQRACAPPAPPVFPALPVPYRQHMPS